MKKATWKGSILAQSNDTILIEGNVYFPPESINKEFFTNSSTHTECVWKGLCSYYNIVVNEEINNDAAWYYHEPKEGSNEIVAQQNKKEPGFSFADYVAFWKGVEISET